jgi:rod shape-determining protein MreC
VLIVLCFLGVVLQKVQSDARALGRIDPVTHTTTAILSPSVIGVSKTSQHLSDFWQGITQASSLTAENRLLKSKLQQARLYDESMERLEQELENLRKFSGFPTMEKLRVPAQVVGWFPHENRMTINVGHSHGIRPMMPVLASDGLIGVVQALNPKTAQVLLISSPRTTIGAIVSNRNPPPVGLLRGDTATTLILSFDDPNVQVASGDTVTTAGFSERIPRGIPIGRVIEVVSNPDFGTKRATIFPNVALGSVRDVVVLK